MKFNYMTKYFLCLSIILLNSSSILADRDYASNDMCCAQDSCQACDCSCFLVQVQAGIAPVVWTRRGNFTAVSPNASLGCSSSTVGPFVPLFEMPQFNKLFKLPWTVGGLVGYWLDDCNEIYIEGNYRQASAKNSFTIAPFISLSLFTLQPQFVFSTISKYAFYDFYVGARHYFDLCWCDSTFFIGGQVGVVHHKAVNFDLTTSSLTNTCAPAFSTGLLTLFNKHTGVAAGGNFGFMFCVCDCVSVILTAEIIATCGPNGTPNIVPFVGCDADVVLPELRPTNFIIGGAGTELFFPITLGLIYNF